MAKDVEDIFNTKVEAAAQLEATAEAETAKAEADKVEAEAAKAEADSKKNGEAAKIDLDVLQAKVANGEEISAEEAKLIATLSIEESEAAKDIKMFNIAGEVKPRQQVLDLARERFKLVEAKLTGVGEDAIIEMYVKDSNENAARRAIDTGYKSNASEREQIARERALLAGERQSLIRLGQNVKKREDSVKKQILEERAMAEVEINAEALEARDPEALSAYSDKRSAVRNLKRLDDELNLLQAEQQQVFRQFEDVELGEFIANNPQYKTTAPLNEIATKINQGLTVELNDKMKYIELRKIVIEQRQMGVPLTDAYEYIKQTTNLKFNGNAQRSNESGDGKVILPDSKKFILDRITSLKAKSGKFVTADGGGNGQRQEVSEKSEAQKLIEQDRLLLGNTDNSQTMKEMGL